MVPSRLGSVVSTRHHFTTSDACTALACVAGSHLAAPVALWEALTNVSIRKRSFDIEDLLWFPRPCM